MLVLGRGAEDLSVGQFLASKEPQTLTGLEGLDHFWKHFEPGCQDDVGHFMGRLWAFSGSSFFGGRFFHVHETGRLEEREQVSLNLLFPQEQTHPTLEDLVTFWSNEGYMAHQEPWFYTCKDSNKKEQAGRNMNNQSTSRSEFAFLSRSIASTFTWLPIRSSASSFTRFTDLKLDTMWPYTVWTMRTGMRMTIRTRYSCRT